MSHLALDPAVFRAQFNRRPFEVRHRLSDHPAFTLPRLILLAQRLPSTDVEYNAGDLPLTMDPTLTPRTGLSIEETIRRIEDCGSWLVMKWVERDPAYHALLNECLDEIQRVTEPFAPGMHRREGFIFISSPRSVTPYHMDQENNFLLQIRGAKTFHVFDRTCATEEEREQRFAGAHRNLTFKDEYQARATTFELQPGSGVHVPVAAPHWIQNGKDVSISFSITFRTHASERECSLYRLNAQLRQWGISPAPVGRSRLRDSLKWSAGRIVRSIRRALRRSPAHTDRRY